MTATALALPTPLPAMPGVVPGAALPAAAAVPQAAPVVRPGQAKADVVAQTAELLRLACRRGQLEDAAAAARVALPLAQPHSPHAAMLSALAGTVPTLMQAPEERRLYMLRAADGRSLGVLRLRDNGHTAPGTPGGTPTAPARWSLRNGSLLLADSQGQPSARFTLCGEQAGCRLYLGEQLADGQACLLQELRCTHARLSLLDPELLDPFCGLYGADAMVGAALPARAALLLGAPHTRTVQLARSLNAQPGLHFDAALLQPEGLPTDEPPLSAAASRTLHALRAKDAAWFVRMMLGRSHDALGRDLAAMRVRGFQMAPSDSPSALAWALAEPGLRIVHVVRSNQLAQFADILAAQQGTAGSAPLFFEPERFGRFIEMQQRHLQALRQRLRQRNGDTVEVDGSRLNAATLGELCGFLSDLPPATPAAGVPADAARVIERFANPDAVLPCLLALDRPGWAEAEGQWPDAG